MKSWKSLVAILGVLVVTACVAVFSSTLALVAFKMGMFEPLAAEVEARAVMYACAKESYPNACYDREIPKLMDKGLTMEEAFMVTRALVRIQPSYAYCHVVAHALGTKETYKDPSAWVSVSGRCPTDICAYGCFHGVVEGRFASTSLPHVELPPLLPTLLAVCRAGSAGSYTRLAEDICVHGVGHLMMFAAGGDIRTALTSCDAFATLARETDAKTNARKFCYEGAFMQVFQSLTPDEEALVRAYAPKTAEEATTFCNQFRGEQKATCQRESWPRSSDTLLTAPGIAAFCGVSEDPWYEQQCYNMVFHVTTSRLEYDRDRITALCSGFTDSRMGQCFAHAASTMVYTDARFYPRALSMCEEAQVHGVGGRCYSELLYFSTYAYHDGSQAFTRYCKAFPEPWRDRCLAREGAQLPSNYIDP